MTEIDFKGKKAVIYARVSTDEQRNGQSLDVQIATCRRWCESKGVEVAKVFNEGDHTGTTLMRPVLSQMIMFCNVENIALAVAYDSSRFSRNDELEPLKKMLPNALLVFADMGVTSDDFMGDMTTAILGKLNKREVTVSHRKTSDSLHEKMRQGFHVARPAAFAIREDLPLLPKGFVRTEPYEVFDDRKKIIVQRKPTTIKSETELWFMASSGFSVPECAREWGVKLTTLKDYLRGREEGEHCHYTIPNRLERYRELTERVRDGKVREIASKAAETPDGKVVADE